MILVSSLTSYKIEPSPEGIFPISRKKLKKVVPFECVHSYRHPIVIPEKLFLSDRKFVRGEATFFDLYEMNDLSRISRMEIHKKIEEKGWFVADANETAAFLQAIPKGYPEHIPNTTIISCLPRSSRSTSPLILSITRLDMDCSGWIYFEKVRAGTSWIKENHRANRYSVLAIRAA